MFIVDPTTDLPVLARPRPTPCAVLNQVRWFPASHQIIARPGRLWNTRAEPVTTPSSLIAVAQLPMLPSPPKTPCRQRPPKLHVAPGPPQMLRTPPMSGVLLVTRHQYPETSPSSLIPVATLFIPNLPVRRPAQPVAPVRSGCGSGRIPPSPQITARLVPVLVVLQPTIGPRSFSASAALWDRRACRGRASGRSPRGTRASRRFGSCSSRRSGPCC